MQGCSVLCPGEAVGEEPVEAEGVDVDGLAHVADPVRAQDVERERAQPGEDAGPAPDPAVVLAQDAVADVVVAVLDAPVGADRPPEARRVQRDLADVVGDLAPGPPQAGAGVLAPAQARDAGRAGDRPPPSRREPALHLEDLDAAMLLAAVPAAVRRLVPVDRLPLGAEPRDRVMQAGLVGLEPDQQGAAGLQLPTSLTSRRGRYTCGFDLCLSPTRSPDVEGLQTAQHRGARSGRSRQGVDSA